MFSLAFETFDSRAFPPVCNSTRPFHVNDDEAELMFERKLLTPRLVDVPVSYGLDLSGTVCPVRTGRLQQACPVRTGRL